MENLNKDRVPLTKHVVDEFFEHVFTGEVAGLSNAKGLSYTLIYNLVHGRIHSLSVADYRRIFGEDPPRKEIARVNGHYFRSMVKLWLFLNDDVTEKDIYREYYRGKRSLKKIDYRIFTGSTKTVEAGLEKMMEKKFLDQGLDREEIMGWNQDLNMRVPRERRPYKQVKPLLDYLKKTLKANPSHLLNQQVKRYEAGELKSISGEIYDTLSDLKERTEKAIAAGSGLEIERLREEVYGKREGYVRFSEVAEELDFLRRYGRMGAKRYLGRGIGPYKKGKLKRIDSRRAEKIVKDCEVFIRNRDSLILGTLPGRHLRQKIKSLTSVLKKSMFTRISSGDDLLSEEGILMPEYHTSFQYEEDGDGFVSIERATFLWDMSKRAFDLLMANHMDKFRKIATYRERWLIPLKYLRETADRRGFSIIREKYEWLVKNFHRSGFTG